MKLNLTHSPKLKTSNVIGIIAPAAGNANIFPHRVQNAVLQLEKLGLKVKFAPHALERLDYTSTSPQQRATDLQQMFTDQSVKAIMCTIGGNHCNQLLKYLDFDSIKQNPKIFIGYSDISVLHYALITKANLQTFYGPCLMTQFGEYPAILPYTLEYFQKALMQATPIGQVKSSKTWTSEILDWQQKEDLKRPRKLEKSTGYQWLKPGKTSGQIIGGCVPSINHLSGTPYWLDPQDNIFFIDLPEGDEFGQGLPLSYVDAYCADLDNLGVFQNIAGLIIGRPYNYSPSQIRDLKKIINYYTSNYNYPILFNVNIGHADPIITLPLGSEVILDSTENLFSFHT